MVKNRTNVNVAPLANVGQCLTALERAAHRPAHLPGMVCFYGPSGWGKSTAASHVATQADAYYVEAKSYWSKKAFLEEVLAEMGIKPERTIHRMGFQASEQLAKSRRPLIIDEMDHLVEKNAVEIVRDLYESSGAAILLIGEEQLPGKLARWERFHGRILDFIPAQPADLDDAMALRALYCHRVDIADDLLEYVVSVAKGSVRRICVNLERIQEEAQVMGRDAIDLNSWGGRELFTGEAPRRRVS